MGSAAAARVFAASGGIIGGELMAAAGRLALYIEARRRSFGEGIGAGGERRRRRRRKRRGG
jgi:hypothetical protein